MLTFTDFLQKKSFSVITAFLSSSIICFSVSDKIKSFFLGLYFLSILDWKGKPVSTKRSGVKGYNDFEHIRVESFRALDVVLWPRNKTKFKNTLAQDWLCPVVWGPDKPPFNLISCQTVTFFSAGVWGPGGGGVTPLYNPYRWVPPLRVWFLHRFGRKTGINFAHFGWSGIE